ncbi:hypothetical protein BYT27DRAFT_7109456 [Phlegmacium glaucopus]|nr:hypothetical protein BYT27DRAFT_7109456 [Phlegmacium glaucopus]
MVPVSIPFKGPRIKQPYDVFLVLDIEGTCDRGTTFNYPNEIIELPVCMLRWTDKKDDGRASALELVDEFRALVRPTWRPTLSAFCTQLTGITQAQVDAAPLFPEVLVKLEAFLVRNGLIDAQTGKRLVQFCWCSDGPFDVRDFVVKQCFISKMKIPAWFRGDVLDVRTLVVQSILISDVCLNSAHAANRRSMNIPAQLKALGLPAFEGRQHSGIDDSRNIAKIITELARRDVCLFPNTKMHPGRRWPWMGKSGHVLEDRLT